MTFQQRLSYEMWFDLKAATLHKGNGEVELTPRAFALLNHLVTHPNQTLSTPELLEAVWPNRYVNDSEVRHYIRELRMALGDNLKAPSFIETVHGKGYRFIGNLPTSEPSISGTSQPAVAIGRIEELARMHEWLARSLVGEGQVVLLIGDHGVGKTTLMKAFEQSLAGRNDVRVARGQCVESYGQGEPFMPILAALEVLCRGASATQVRNCLERYAPLWLLQLPDQIGSADLAALRDRTRGATMSRMLRELIQALAMLTKEWGLVLWLEDLHWADASTITLIDYLARHQPAMRLLLIGATRPPAAIANPHPLRNLHTELSPHQYCHDLVLTSFDAAKVGNYLEAQFPGLPLSLTAAVHRHTDGNPLFIVNVMDQLKRRKVIVATEGQWTLNVDPNTLVLGVPENLRGMIAQRFEQLEQDERQLLTVAGIAGVEFSAASLTAALKWDVAAVEECCIGLAQHNRFLRREGEERWPDGTLSGRYAFSHALYQQALYEKTTPGKRRNTHRLIGTRLEQGYAGQIEEIAALLAWHFEGSGDFTRAIQYFSKAGQVASKRQAMNELG